LDRRRIEFGGFDRQGVDHLAARLAHRRQADEPARQGKARLFRGLALGGEKLVLAVLDLALGDRPGAVVLARPVLATGMHQKERKLRRAPEDHQAGAVAAPRHQSFQSFFNGPSLPNTGSCSGGGVPAMSATALSWLTWAGRCWSMQLSDG